MTLLDFLASVAASIIAGIVLLAFSPVVFRSARAFLTQLAGRVLRIDVDYVFKDLKDASEDMVMEISQAASVNHDLTRQGPPPQRASTGMPRRFLPAAHRGAANDPHIAP